MTKRVTSGLAVLAGLFGLFLAPGVTNASQPQARQPEGASGRSANYDQGRAQQPPLAVRIVQSKDETASTDARAQRAEEREKDQLAAQRAATNAAWLQTIFGILSIALLTWTLWYTRKTANAAVLSAEHASEALSHTLTAADAAARSAGAAEGALALGHDQLTITTRPYITVNPHPNLAFNSTVGGGDGPSIRGDWLLVSGTVKNVGSSPAINATVYIQFSLVDSGLEPVWQGDGPPPEDLKTSLFPNELYSTANCFFSPSDCDDIHNNRKTALIKINIYYDGLRTDRRYETSAVYKLHLRTNFSEIRNGNASGINLQPIAGGVVS